MTTSLGHYSLTPLVKGNLSTPVFTHSCNTLQIVVVFSFLFFCTQSHLNFLVQNFGDWQLVVNKVQYLKLNIAADKDKLFAGHSVAVLSSFSRNWKGLVVVDKGCSDSYDCLWSFAKVHASTQCSYDYCYRLTTKFYLLKRCNGYQIRSVMVLKVLIVLIITVI